MTGQNEDNTEVGSSRVGKKEVQQNAISSTYKVQGEDALSDGAGVLGSNTASSGTPIGVEGTVADSSVGYGLATPDDARIDGTAELGGLAGSITGNTEITDLVGSGLSIENKALTASGDVTDVSDDGSTVVTDVEDINFSSNLRVSDDGDGTVTVDPIDLIESLTGGDGIDPGSIVDGDTLSVAWGDATDFDPSGAIVSDAVDSDDLATPFADLATLVGSPVTAGGYVDLGGNSLVNTGTVNASSGSSLTVNVDSTTTAMELTPGASDVSDGGLLSSPPNVVIGGPSNNTGGSAPSGAAICGGQFHEASADHAIVCGGYGNVASGRYAFAAGVDAYAENDNVFVWNDLSSWSDTNGDGTKEGLTSAKAVDGEPVTGSSTFSVGASEGVRMVTGDNSVTYIDGGSAGWSTTSSRAAKTNIDPVDPQDVLAGVTDMEVATWEYTDDTGDAQGVRHIGPMAEDFHHVVDVGSSDDHINSMNADGVLFAAVQGLSQKLDQRDDRVEELEADRDELKAENERLRDRIAKIETHIGLDGAAEPAAADD